ncbi:hypothetical protein PNOK_0590900 [Pyrrhoderma noxium]|uniref:Uncharacterized protein n=1 Tax=Pyrrhoderma noxium TaxID=2282107 RepID=A0A286UHX4_9AGAM|nr:hypothetical protein PNOK_0590900 [Pyrrhoderma noxium]
MSQSLHFTNNWDDSRHQLVLQSPFQRTKDADIYDDSIPQRVARTGPIRTMTPSEFSLPCRSPVSGISSAMSTASTSQRPRNSSEQSTNSSPSSDGSNQSNQKRELQLHWDMGISESVTSVSENSHDLYSPAQVTLLPFDSLNIASGIHSPYLPPVHLPDSSMSHSPYAPHSVNGGRYYPQRSSSTTGIQSSPNMVLSQSYPQSAPPNNVTGFSMGLPLQTTPSPPTAYASPNDDPEKLKMIIRELQTRIQELSSQAEHLHSQVNASRFAQSLNSSGPIPTSPQMEASWNRRTEARVRKFCSPNRAGNALCAWHDTRRERRAYPPRMAPQGTLNCGCTVEEALFEESLARHSVGSYLPGDSVRMDPALRNPLLRLLQQRYGYRDGDFEREPLTGAWQENEGPERWEAELQRGNGTRHR